MGPGSTKSRLAFYKSTNCGKKEDGVGLVKQISSSVGAVGFAAFHLERRCIWFLPRCYFPYRVCAFVP